jgi:hypothetical protein
MLAFVIAHEIGHLYGGPPKTQTQKYSCSGQADYAAITGIMPHAWYGRYYQDVLQGAVAQLDTFFGYFGDGPIAQGTSGDTCLDISIECRKQVIKAAMSTFDLPECAGGPKASTLEVTGAVASRAQDGTEVVVSFSAPIGVDALASEHYKLVPEAAVKTAEIKSGEGSKIYLQIDGVKPGVEYTLMVKDVLSADGHPLIARKSTATFTLKEEET